MVSLDLKYWKALLHLPWTRQEMAGGWEKVVVMKRHIWPDLSKLQSPPSPRVVHGEKRLMKLDRDFASVRDVAWI